MIERFVIDNLINIISKTSINLNENAIFNFLKNQKRWPLQYPTGQPSVEVISELGTKVTDFFDVTRDGTFLNFDRWYNFHKKGFTTTISNVLDLDDELRTLRSNIKEELGTSINGNFYFSRPGKRASFFPHDHPYLVIVKQIYGKSKWQVGGKEFILKPNEVCLIPEYTPHAVIEKKENKLSLTLNIE